MSILFTTNPAPNSDLAEALAEAEKATVSFESWIRTVQTKANYDPKQAHWYKAGLALERAVEK